MDLIISSIIIFFIATIFLIFLIRFMDIKKSYGHQEKRLIDYFANFYGVSSKGMKQVRGNGMLLLSSNSLYFEMYIPRKKYAIPLNQIVEINKTHGHLGKVGFNLLKVRYKDGNQYEEAAWEVNHVDEWIKQLTIMSQ